MNTSPTSQAGEAEVASLREYRAATQGTESGTLEDDILELGGRTPLQALSAAYAERIALLRALAPAEELMASTALIATLERTILRRTANCRASTRPGNGPGGSRGPAAHQ